LVEFYKESLISLEDVLFAATSPHEFKLLLTKATGQAY
jgi:twitching motility protein PilT